MLEEVLAKLGLGEKDTRVFLALLERRSARASDLARQLRLPRTTVQNVLLRLERQSFVSQVGEKNAQCYSAVHPETLLDLYRSQTREQIRSLQQTETELAQVVPQIMGMLHSAKAIPQVRFFRGREGARQVLHDTLNSKTELKDFANIDAMFEVIKDINDAYVAEREKTTVTKRSLLLDTAFARKVYEGGHYSPKSHRGFKWMANELYPFTIEMNIYDGRVSYLTYVQEDLVGVIIENEHIYRMHDSMWNLIWDLLPSPKHPTRSGEPYAFVTE